MRARSLILALTVLVTACREVPSPHQDPEVSGWRRVLALKKLYASEPTPANRQRYADAVASFVRQNPQHRRAREVYDELEIAFAQELLDSGRAAEAVRHYRSVLQRAPANVRAREGLATALRLASMTRERLRLVTAGMSRDEVRRILGPPPPGWSRKTGQTQEEAWYYRRQDGGVAGVFFSNGRLFAVEYDVPFEPPAKPRRR